MSLDKLKPSEPNQDQSIPVMTMSDFNTPGRRNSKIALLSESVRHIGDSMQQSGQMIDVENSLLLNSQQIVSLVHPSFRDDPDARRGMLINVAATALVKRKSGEMYATHPKEVSDLAAEVYANFTDRDFAKQVYIVAEIHDAAEEGPVRYAADQTYPMNWHVPGDTSTPDATLKSSTAYADGLFPPHYQAGRRMMLTMEPPVGKEYMDGAEYAGYIRLMAEHGDPVVWAACLIDKAANVFSLYGNKPLEQQKDIDKATKNFAKYRYLAKTFMEKATAMGQTAVEQIQPAYHLFDKAWNIAKTQQPGVTIEAIETWEKRYEDAVTQHKEKIDADLMGYLSSLDSSASSLTDPSST